METRRLGQEPRDLLLRSGRTPRLPGRFIGENGLGDIAADGEARPGHARMKFLPQRFGRAVGNRGVASLPLRHAQTIAAPSRPPPRANRARMSATDGSRDAAMPLVDGIAKGERNLAFARSRCRHTGRGPGRESLGRGCKGRGSPLRDGFRESGSLPDRDATPTCCAQPGRARCPQANSARLTASVGPNPPTRIRSLTAGPEGGTRGTGESPRKVRVVVPRTPCTKLYSGFPCYNFIIPEAGRAMEICTIRCRSIHAAYTSADPSARSLKGGFRADRSARFGNRCHENRYEQRHHDIAHDRLHDHDVPGFRHGNEIAVAQRGPGDDREIQGIQQRLAANA